MVYRLGDCELDAACFELRRGEETVSVEPQVLELLLYLVANRDRVVTRSELFENLWRGRIVSDSALNSRIKAARAALGDNGTSQAQIRTLHRTGYRFVGAVEELAADASRDDGSAAIRSVRFSTPPRPPMPLWNRLRLAAGTGGVLLAVGAFALLPRGPDGDAAQRVATVQPAGVATTLPDERNSLAVLPFANLSADEEQEYFADGIGVDLLNRLSRLPDVRVTGHASSGYFKGRSDPLPSIASQLGVTYVLTGSVRKAGERVRIVVELVEAASGDQLWSDSFDRQLGDIFDVQDEIATRVATALQVKLGLGESAEVGMTRNVAAYDEFLRGTAAYTQQTPESYVRAVEHMLRASALDPEFSRPWAYLYCIYLDGSFVVPGRAEEWANKAVQALDRARELTPDAPFVQILDARESMRFGRRLEAQAALETLPDGYWTGDRYLTKDVFLGRFLISGGYARKAIDSLERSRAADPLSPVSALNLSVAYAMAGDTSAALAETDRALALGDPIPALIGNAMLVALGANNAAEIRARTLVRDGGNLQPINEAMLRHLDNPAAARVELRRIVAKQVPPDFIRTVVVTHWAAYYGDTELALEQLRSIAHGSADEALLWRPVLSEVRRHPGFKDIAREEGLVEYWRAHGWPDFCRPTVGDDFECR